MESALPATNHRDNISKVQWKIDDLEHKTRPVTSPMLDIIFNVKNHDTIRNDNCYGCSMTVFCCAIRPINRSPIPRKLELSIRLLRSCLNTLGKESKFFLCTILSSSQVNPTGEKKGATHSFSTMRAIYNECLLLSIAIYSEG